LAEKNFGFDSLNSLNTTKWRWGDQSSLIAKFKFWTLLLPLFSDTIITKHGWMHVGR
jgi:hypothetical protein